MPIVNYLYKDSIAINDSIKIVIPTVGDIIKDEDEYYSLVSAFTAMPIDYMVQLYDSGYDFSEMNAFQLFLFLFPAILTKDTSLIFGDLDLKEFRFALSEQNGEPVLIDTKRDIVIDRAIHGQIATTLRKIHHLSRNNRKPGNEEARKYMLERARLKLARQKRKKRESTLEPLIVAMVNTEQYKYDYQSTLGLSVYQFNESVRQIQRKIDFDNRMIGVYAGTVDVSKANPADLTWIGLPNSKEENS